MCKKCITVSEISQLYYITHKSGKLGVNISWLRTSSVNTVFTRRRFILTLVPFTWFCSNSILHESRKEHLKNVNSINNYLRIFFHFFQFWLKSYTWCWHIFSNPTLFNRLWYLEFCQLVNSMMNLLFKQTFAESPFNSNFKCKLNIVLYSSYT